ncbi:MAG: hypothetical protein NC117_05870 [Pseudoflavonifractor sp.]|nr:hypothetical protein [Pseudoflavonifractor sp.]
MRFSIFKKIVPFFIPAMVMLSSCSKDSEPELSPDDPNKPETVDPTAPTSDPTGTVVMRMRNDNETKLGNMIISADNNFSCSGTNNMIASIGPVSGLGNITDIPLTGWSDNVAVEIGNGYVYYDGSQYYRIYAVQWLKDALTDAIIGAELKYQSPFKGIDEEIGVDNLALSFSGDGGEDDIFFTNTSVIPFTVSSDQDWCYVERCTSTTKDEDFLYDGIHLTVQKNTTKNEDKAKIIIQTLYGKRTVITVTRGGETPSVVFPNGETSFERTDIPANGETQTMTLSANVEMDEIAVSSNANWLSAELYPYGSTAKSTQKSLRAIEGHDGITSRSRETRASNRLTLRYTVNPNYSSDIRQAKISLNTTSGTAIAAMSFTQNAGILTLDDEAVECSSSEQDFTFTFTTNVGGEYSITSDAAWCTPAYPEYNVSVDNMTTRSTTVRLSITDNISEKSRTANVTIAAKDGSLKTVLRLTQSPTSFDNMPSTLYFDRNASNQQIQLPVKGLRVKSAVDWCSVSVNGTTLTVRVAAADVNRKTTLTIEGFSGKITVDQSKYAIGDSYDEKGIVGKVCHMSGETRLVRSENLGSASYSNEDVLIGTSDMDNGLANMAVVKSIAGWQNFYPAFALCDALNVDGVTGWYLPAANEATGESGWSSTEYDTQRAYYWNGTSTYDTSKDMAKPVYAVHHFVE